MSSSKEILPSSSFINDNDNDNDSNIIVDIETNNNNNNNNNNNEPINNRRASWPPTRVQQQQIQKNLYQQKKEKNNEEEDDDDPTWLKWKGTIGKQLGNLESSIGSMVGLHGLENNGQQWKEWGSDTIDRSHELTEQGAPSRIDGEYNRLMGHLCKTLGHIIGDEEMEYNNSKRIYDANEEIVQSRKKSLE